MSRSFATAELLSAAVTKAIKSRGFSSSAAAVQGKAAVSAADMVKKTGEQNKQRVSSWVPDPRTGFYRPDNVAEEIDPAELRALLLKKH